MACEDRRMGIECRRTGEDSCEIEAKAIDAQAGEMAQSVQHHGADHRIRPVQDIAGAGIVDQRPIRPMGIAAIVQAAQTESRPRQIAFAGVVQHQIQDHANAGLPQNRDGVAQLVDAARRQTGIDRHRYDGIVSPGIAKPERWQMPLVDPGHDRHQFDGVHAQFLQVRDNRRMSQRANGAAQRRQVWRDGAW